MITVFYDGCCEPRNPGGNAGFGAVIYVHNREAKRLSLYTPAHPENSNNVAEYKGLTCALEWLLENSFEKNKVRFFGDNMMTVMQMNGKWKARSGMYIPHYMKARDLGKKFKNLKFKWIPREQNDIADDLSKTQLKDRGVKFKIQPEG